MKNKLTFLLLCSIISLGWAQSGELPIPYAHNYMLDNPAATAMDRQHHIFVGAARKWLSIPDAPTTLFVSSAHPISRALGIGGIIIHDEAALLKSTKLGLQATIHLNPESTHRFSLGASAGFRFFGFDAPQSTDILPETGENANKISLGIAANYQTDFGKKDAFFNLYAYIPQFKNSIELLQDTNSLNYDAVNGLIIQANLVYPIIEGIALTPAFRYQTAPFGGFSSNKQLIDFSIGASFMNNKLQLRLGMNNSNTSTIYGGIGFSFGDTRIHIIAEPSSPFGMSAYFDGEFVFDSNIEPKEQNPKDKKRKEKLKPKPKFKTAVWEDENRLKERLAARNLAHKITPKVVPESAVFSYQFEDGLNMALDYFKNIDFSKSVPIQNLFLEINEITALIKKEKKEITLIELRANVRETLDEASYQAYKGQAFNLSYLEAGNRFKTRPIETEDQLTEGELAAVKLHILVKRLKEINANLKDVEYRIYIRHTPEIQRKRIVSIGFEVKD